MSPRRVLLATATAVAAIAASGIGAAGATAQSAPPGLDHFLCYNATATPVAGTPNLLPPAVLVQDQLDGRLGHPQGRYVAIKAAKMHCNPVEKELPTGQVYPITKPEGHLVCWVVAAPAPDPALPSVRAIIENQFGQGRVIINAMKRLCVPSWKNETAPQFPTPTAPPGLDHFTCYGVKPTGTPQFTPPATVTLRDQFGQLLNVPVGAVTELCIPARKTPKPHQPGQPPTNPDAHLLCFKVTRTVARTPFVKNQFGIFRVQTSTTAQLCLPSFKTLVGTAGTA